MTLPRRSPFALRALTTGAILFALALSAPARQDPDGTRNLWDTEFLQKRPQGSGTPKKNPTYRRKKRVVATTTPKPATALASDSVLGVTIWRLRPSTSSDTGAARILVHEEADDAVVELTPERVDTDMPLAEGQYVRLAVEVPRKGYLYVINREMLADGKYGRTYLIFPTLRLGGGANEVSAGSVVEIPSQSDTPSYFTLEKSGDKHIGEEIMLLVTPEPLADLKIGRSALELAPAQVSEWERKWGGTFEQLDLEGGKGTTYSPAEKQAGTGGKLTQADPMPQTIFKVAAQPGTPFLVRVPLRIQ